MTSAREPDTPLFTVLVAGPGLDPGMLAALAPDPIKIYADVADPDCVVIGYADDEQVRAVHEAHPRTLVLSVAPLVPVAAVFAAGAEACLRDADPRLVVAQLRALWRSFGPRQPRPGQGAAAVRRAESDLAAGPPDHAGHDHEPKP